MVKTIDIFFIFCLIGLTKSQNDFSRVKFEILITELTINKTIESGSCVKQLQHLSESLNKNSSWAVESELNDILLPVLTSIFSSNIYSVKILV